MYYKISDFIEDWKYESESTIKVLSNLTDEVLTVQFNNEIRTAGRLAWHIVTSIGEMAHRTGLTFETIDENAAIPSTIKEIVEEYKRASDGMIKEIKSKWKDETLLLEDDYFFAACMVKHFSLNEGILNNRITNDDLVTIFNQKNLIEIYLGSFNCFKSVNVNFLSFLNLELLSCNLYYCVHFNLCLRFSVRRTHFSGVTSSGLAEFFSDFRTAKI